MKIRVNGADTEFSGETLADLLSTFDQSDAKVATAVNETFVPVSARATHSLSNGDRVEIVAPQQGG